MLCIVVFLNSIFKIFCMLQQDKQINQAVHNEKRNFTEGVQSEAQKAAA